MNQNEETKKVVLEFDETTYEDLENAAKSVNLSVDLFVKAMFIQGLLALNKAVEVSKN